MSTPTNPDYNGKTPEPELVPQSLRGYRVWQIMRGLHANIVYWDWNEELDPNSSVQTEEVFVLKGQYGGTWPLIPNTPMKAECTKTVSAKYYSEHKAPDESCTCGIYARYTLDSVSRAYLASAYTMEPSISGAIKATGKTIMGEKGFRTATAEIEALVVPYEGLHPNSTEIIHRAAKMLGVKLYWNVDEFLYDYPSNDLLDLGIEPYKDHVYREQISITGRRSGRNQFLVDYGYDPKCSCNTCSRRTQDLETKAASLKNLPLDLQPTDFTNWQWNSKDQQSNNTDNNAYFPHLLSTITDEQKEKIVRDLMGGGA